MPKTSKAQGPKFKVLEVMNTVVLKGGYLKEPTSLPVMNIPNVGEFVRIDKCDAWVIRTVCGAGAARRALTRTRLLDVLREKLVSVTLTGSVFDETEEELPAAVAADTDDPMAKFNFEEGAEASEAMPSNTKQKKPKYIRKFKKDIVVRVTMPSRCKEKYPDDVATREVKLWVKDRRQLYLHASDIPWALEYLHDQYEMGGISAKVDNPGGSAQRESIAANEEAPDIHTPVREVPRQGGVGIKWLFEPGCWLADFSTPDGKPHCMRLKPDDLTFANASAVADLSGPEEFNTMSYPEKKALSAEYLRSRAQVEMDATA